MEEQERRYPIDESSHLNPITKFRVNSQRPIIKEAFNIENKPKEIPSHSTII